MNTWRYLMPNGRRAHLLTGQGCGTHSLAACGVSPLWFDPVGWRGGDDDYEAARTLARALPCCRRCVRISGVRR